MKNSSFLIVLLLSVSLFNSCKTETEKERQLINKKASIEAATIVVKTPLMLGTSVYSQISKKENISTFTNALSTSLKELLMGTAGPYTVFTPTNDAIENSSIQNLDDMFLKKYIVKGKLTTSHLVKRIREHNGAYTFISIAGTELKAKRDGMEIVIEDVKGNKAILQLTDYLAENGVVHIIENILE